MLSLTKKVKSLELKKLLKIKISHLQKIPYLGNLPQERR